MIKSIITAAIVLAAFGMGTKAVTCESVQIRHEVGGKQILVSVPCAGDFPQVSTYYSPPGPGECEVRVNTYDRFGPFVVSIDWPVGVITPTIEIDMPAH